MSVFEDVLPKLHPIKVLSKFLATTPYPLPSTLYSLDSRICRTNLANK
jgi:hypothetical protein